MSDFEWMPRFATPQACLAEIAHHRWPRGFIYARCGPAPAFVLSRGPIRQCARCRHPVAVTAGPLFHKTPRPLPKWLAAINLMSADKGGISALRLAKRLGVSWRSAHRLLRLLRRARRDRDRSDGLSGLIEVDEAWVGGRRPGKRGRGAAGKTPVRRAIENRGTCAGDLAAQALSGGVNQAAVAPFARGHLAGAARLRSDALPARATTTSLA